MVTMATTDAANRGATSPAAANTPTAVTNDAMVTTATASAPPVKPMESPRAATALPTTSPGKPTTATASAPTPLSKPPLPVQMQSGDQGKRTWTSLFAPQATTSSTTKLHYQPPTMDGDKFLITATPEELAEGQNHWQNTLVGHFIGSRPPYHIVKTRLEAMWKPTGGMQILTLPAGFYIFRFTLAEDRNRILEGGPWFILNRILLLKPWDQNTRLQKIDLSTVPVWIKIHNLPMSLWTPTLISRIASCAGVPLHMDQATAAKTRISYARVCVEVSAEQQLPTQISFTVNGEQDYILQLEYDRRPPQCSRCCTFGHNDTNCPLQQTKDKPIWRPKQSNQTQTALISQSAPNSTIPTTTHAESPIRATPAQSPAKHSQTHSSSIPSQSPAKHSQTNSTQKQAESKSAIPANPAAHSKETPSLETNAQKGKQLLPQGNQTITVNNRFHFLENDTDNEEQDPTDLAGPSTVVRYKPPDPHINYV